MIEYMERHLTVSELTFVLPHQPFASFLALTYKHLHFLLDPAEILLRGA